MQLRTDKRVPFDASVDEVWAAMCNVGSYQQWWPWLEEFHADALAVGETWRCDIRAPLRYHVRFTLKFIVVVPATHIECSLRGDISGGAWIDPCDGARGRDIEQRRPRRDQRRGGDRRGEAARGAGRQNERVR